MLRLVGELDLAASGGFRERVETALAAGVRNVVLDMADALFIDSSMLKELLRANTATRRSLRAARARRRAARPWSGCWTSRACARS